MRLLATADLHYNQPRSRAMADDLIHQLNHAGGDVLLLIGDTAPAATEHLERCLDRFSAFHGAKLFVAGNHELWTHDPDSYQLFREELPRRIRSLGWHWLEGNPFTGTDTAIVGSIGWYDYSFAQEDLGIPRRFYEHKISPGAARAFEQFAHLFAPADDISPLAMRTIARWNDGKFVKLHRSDDAFLAELLNDLSTQLQSLQHVRHILAATHHLPCRQILPPPHSAQWDFAKAFLGSQRLGDLLLQFENVRHILCGHSHMAAEAEIGPTRVINIGSGYRWKTYRSFDLPD